MIQDPSKELTLVVYDSPKPPKYLKINKVIIRVLIFLIPVVIILSVAFSLFTSVYLKQKLEMAKSQEPEIILKLREVVSTSENEIEALNKTNSQLIQKISTGQATATSDEMGNLFNLFSIPLGFEDNRPKENAKLENMSNDILKDKMLFKFDILNNQAGDEKLAGFISIVQYHKDGLSFYPNYDLSLENPNLIFSKGESFVVSRFRPVIAEFKKPKGSVVWYKVYIFSQTGNLIAFKKAGPFTLD
jgi:hypothetical protein